MIQSEAQLETGLVKRLHSLGWDPVTITDGAGLRANLKAQLEAHNGVTLSDAEFTRTAAGDLAASVFCHRHRVVSSGTARSRFANFSRLATLPVVCLKRQFEQGPDRQAKRDRRVLDRRIREHRRPTGAAVMRREPGHLLVQPDQQ